MQLERIPIVLNAEQRRHTGININLVARLPALAGAGGVNGHVCETRNRKRAGDVSDVSSEVHHNTC